jgi:cytochrome c
MPIPYRLSKRTALVLGVAASLSLTCSFAELIATAQAQGPELQSPRAKQIEALVGNAAQLVNSKGRAAFDDFRQKGSEWFTGDTYIFIIDMKGTELFNAAFPKFEGQNVLDLKDKSGKFMNRSFIELLEKQDAGWVDYMWPKPGTNQIAKKWTYIKRINVQGTPAGLGAGIYLD